MNKQTSRSWWSSLGLGKRAVDDGDDFGDMGTAFGLDASMAGPLEGDDPTRPGAFDADASGRVADRLKRRSTL